MDFFFFLRPGEYCKGGKDAFSPPFRLWDTSFLRGERRFKGHWDATDTIIDAIDFTALMFNNKKKGL